ncbi:MAG: sodium:solute symporter family protein [Sutterellaceae bacterium]|nr:cation acetate symporter [Burkholderiaceae bacterium]MDW8430745.1 sodium:solute symporter family protein [Sutterellaceae bacterium]
MSAQVGSQRQFYNALKKYYSWYTGGFLAFIVVLAILEQLGLSRAWIGYIFLFATIALYAGIGIMSRTAEVAEYYVAGRRVPAIFNGMATGSDWMSAASFIGMAGGLYLQGFDGLAFIMGWTGGYCLVAFLLAPYLRKFGQFTIPDFLGARYGGNLARAFGIIIAISVSFVYVVAQIYGVGLITSRFTGLAFDVGVFVGLAGILVCSFLGGMRAVTWTQVAQYIILIIAYLIPVAWLGVKHAGFPVPQLVYGHLLQKVTELEQKLTNDPKEQEVRKIFADRAANLRKQVAELPASWEQGRADLARKLEELKAANAPVAEINAAQKALDTYPKSPDEARKAWTTQATAAAARSSPPMPHATPFPSLNPDPVKNEQERNTKRLNFLTLVFCLMLGTAALPHILMRYYTTPSVNEARKSVFWSLFFIFLLYFSAPALAVMVKYEVYGFVVGSKFSELPAWVAGWSKVDPRLLTITDVNKDGIVQLAEITLGQDIIVLATPEIAGLPYVISGLVAAGGLAAALSTADGLLLTIANALSHDLYYKMINPNASTQKRVTISKILLLIVAVLAAWTAQQAPADILFLVSAAFSLAAAGFFVPLVAGVFWKRATKWGAIAAMIGGSVVTWYYMITTQPWLRSVFGITGPVSDYMWFGISPISAGIFGLPVALVLMIVVSLLTPAPDERTQDFVEHVRYPNLKGEKFSTLAT